MHRPRRVPVVQLDNYKAYLTESKIEVPITGIGDPLVHDLLHMIHESGHKIYFEEAHYTVLEWELSSEHNALTLKVERGD